MKNSQIIFSFLVLFCVTKANAQFSLNVSIGAQPTYHHHDNYYYEDNIDYYYLPEVEAYFDNRSGLFIYYGPRGWVRAQYLPESCGDYNLNTGTRIALDYHGRAPYVDFHYHKQRYCKPHKKQYVYHDKCHGKKKHYNKKHYRDQDDD